MKKQSKKNIALGLVGLFSAVLLANIDGQSMVQATGDSTAGTIHGSPDGGSLAGTQSSVKLRSNSESVTASASTDKQKTASSEPSVKVTQPQAATTLAEAAFQLTNHHSEASNQATTNDHAMGAILSAKALAAMTDETGSTSTKHVLRMPAGLDEEAAGRWLSVAKQQATADYAKTGRSQQIIMLAATTPEVKCFAVGDASVPEIDAIDVASWQRWMGQAQYTQLKQKGVKTVIVKLTEGTDYSSPYAATQIKYAKNAGMGVAVYHFADFNSVSSAKNEANAMVVALRKSGLPKNTRVFADMEAEATNVANIGVDLKQFWAVLDAAGYANHAVYTGGSWGSEYANTVANTVGHSKTWYAAYPYTPTATSTLESFKGFDYGAWQFSSTAHLSGYPQNTIDVSDDYSGVLTNLTGEEQGPWLPKTGYITVKSPNYDFWRSFSFTKGASTKSYAGQELVVKGMYHHSNGSTYYSVYNKSGKWLGYLNAQATSWQGEQGTWHADDRYVAITQSANVYGGFDFKIRYSAGTLTNRVFHSKGKYYHMNGRTYLSLYDGNDRWVGYVNEKAVSETTAAGVWQPEHGYITFDNKNHDAYRDLQDSQILTSGRNLFGHTYKVTGKYVGIDGKVRYSIYTMTNKWLGYVDGTDVSPSNNQQGRWLAHDGYFTTTLRKQKIWSSFAFHAGKSTSTYYRNTYRINGEYFHSNGSKYYSLYSNAGKWLGYVNAGNGKATASAAGAWLPNNQKVKVAVKNYPLWHGLFDKQMGTTARLYQKTYHVNGNYHHFNGSWYDSLYTGKDWIGYVNINALKVVK